MTHRRSGGRKGSDQGIGKRDSGIETRTKAVGKGWREYGPYGKEDMWLWVMGRGRH